MTGDKIYSLIVQLLMPTVIGVATIKDHNAAHGKGKAMSHTRFKAAWLSDHGKVGYQAVMIQR